MPSHENCPCRCRTYINMGESCCRGMLAQKGGRTGKQQWYAGRFPSEQAPLSLQFVEAVPIGALAAPIEEPRAQCDLSVLLAEMRLARLCPNDSEHEHSLFRTRMSNNMSEVPNTEQV